jgi:hypothetical protein
MSEKTYKGSCHCGRVKFEADLDLSAGIGKCNCTFCTKVRNFSMTTKPDKFRLLSGEDDLTYYPGGKPTAPNTVGHPFCKHCGVRAFSHGHLDPIGGDFVSVFVSALDDADPKEIAAAPVRYSDGRANNWWNPPEVTAHL